MKVIGASTDKQGHRCSIWSRVSWVDLVSTAVAPMLAVVIADVWSKRDIGFIQFADYSFLAAFISSIVCSLLCVDCILARYFSIGDFIRGIACSSIATVIVVISLFYYNILLEITPTVVAINWLMLTILIMTPRLLSRVRATRARPARVAKVRAGQLEILVGVNDESVRYIQTAHKTRLTPDRVTVIVDPDDQYHGKMVGGAPIVGALGCLQQVSDKYAVHGLKVDRIVIADKNIAPGTNEWKKIEKFSLRTGCQIRSIEEAIDIICDEWRRQISEELAPVSSIEIPPRTSYHQAKFIFDRVASGLTLLALSPAFLILAGVVAIDVGFPVLFWQQRAGQYGRNFWLFKFRTLKGPVDRSGQIIPEERRLSAIGRALRASRLDELPQFFNVLRGDMSLVGPRPLLPIDQPADSSVRLLMKPGITGWAQVNGGKLLDVNEKACLDEYYVREANLLLDLKTLFLTIKAVLFGDRRDEKLIRQMISYCSSRRSRGEMTGEPPADNATSRLKELLADRV